MTNPTMSAEERAEKTWICPECKTEFRDFSGWKETTSGQKGALVSQRWLEREIRQAEQAARQQGKEEGRRKALEEAANICASSGWHGGLLSDQIRALAQEPEEVG